MDHRAKNALALVQGIVRLSRADSTQGYAEAVQGRVESLARAHSLLAAARWRNVPLSRVIESETERRRRQNLTLEGPLIEVRPEQVQPLALVIHELLSNASEHGALSRQDGRVSIRWRLDDEDRRIVIEWEEQGGPAPPSEPIPGFGSTLIRTTMERQLGGAVGFDWASEGLRIRLELPARDRPALPDAG